MRKTKLIFTTLAIAMLFSSCVNEKKVGQILKEHPEILQEAIKADPAGFIMTLQEAASEAKDSMEKKKFEKSFDDRLAPNFSDEDATMGNPDGPLVLVEYSDFECPYCSRGYSTMKQFMEKYKGKVKFVYKHLPLSFHKQAMISAQYFEAIKMQDMDKAFKFHDEIFKSQRSLKNGEKFLKKIAQKVGADMKKLAKDLNSDAVKSKIKADMAEAAKFDIQGTPGFVLNGVPIRGAYPISHFEMIVEELKKRDIVKL